MTPSGGARNPYDAVVYVREVSSLSPGLYRYSPFSHSLIKFSNGVLPSIVDILGGQAWADDAAAVVFLIAQFERTMWKYPHPGAYRVVMMEAGHIAQNMVLVATKNQVKSVTTAAINDELAEKTFAISSITQSVCYAVALGMPRESP
jgi:SagB-type dehydrogenase family enzyme